MSGWLTVHLVDAPERAILVSVDKMLSLGEDPAGGARVVLTNGTHYDVTEDLADLAAQLTQAGR